MKSVLIGLAGVLLWVSPAQAQSTPVTECGQILKASGSYHLKGNLGPCTGDGVVITASKVDFTLAGFTITGVSTAAKCDLIKPQLGINVSSGAVSDVHISGGTISHFVDGIGPQLGTNSRVYAMTLTESCRYGIAVGNSNSSQLDTNVVTGNELDGVSLQTSHDITIDSNYISQNKRAGVGVSNKAHNNTIKNNIFNNNGGDGVAVFEGNDNTILNNASNRNGSGIRLASPTTTGNVAQGNTTNGNSDKGIYILAGGTKNGIKGNTAMGNKGNDMVDANACGSNTWGANTFMTDQVAGTSDGGPGAECIQ